MHMVSIDYGYIIVDKSDNMYWFTLATNKKDSWVKFMESYHVIYADREAAKRGGYKCVRVELQTEEYSR
jgi:hypothetical protein